MHDIVAEGMLIHERELGMDAVARTARVVTLLDHVGLGRDHLHRYGRVHNIEKLANGGRRQ